MTFVSTSCREFDSGQLVLDISDGAAIRYSASKVDDEDDNGKESTGDAAEDDDDEDDSDDDGLDGDLHKTVTEIANKTDDSGFCSTPRLSFIWLQDNLDGQGAIIFIKGASSELLHPKWYAHGVLQWGGVWS